MGRRRTDRRPTSPGGPRPWGRAGGRVGIGMSFGRGILDHDGLWPERGVVMSGRAGGELAIDLHLSGLSAWTRRRP